MNRTEILKLLAMAAVIDPRVSRKTDQEKSAMASAWLELLGDMPLDFAVTVLKKHYQESTEAIMPADLMKPYKIHKRQQAEKQQLLEITSRKVLGSMPPDVRARLVELKLLKP